MIRRRYDHYRHRARRNVAAFLGLASPEELAMIDRRIAETEARIEDAPAVYIDAERSAEDYARAFANAGDLVLDDARGVVACLTDRLVDDAYTGPGSRVYEVRYLPHAEWSEPRCNDFDSVFVVRSGVIDDVVSGRCYRSRDRVEIAAGQMHRLLNPSPLWPTMLEVFTPG